MKAIRQCVILVMFLVLGVATLPASTAFMHDTSKPHSHVSDDGVIEEASVWDIIEANKKQKQKEENEAAVKQGVLYASAGAVALLVVGVFVIHKIRRAKPKKSKKTR